MFEESVLFFAKLKHIFIHFIVSILYYEQRITYLTIIYNLAVIG